MFSYKIFIWLISNTPTSAQQLTCKKEKKKKKEKIGFFYNSHVFLKGSTMFQTVPIDIHANISIYNQKSFQ